MNPINLTFVKQYIHDINKYYSIKQKKNNKNRNKDAHAFYLTTDWWAHRRVVALQLDGTKCTKCDALSNLQVHHKTYKNVWCERDEDLTTLCELCHMKEHDIKPIVNIPITTPSEQPKIEIRKYTDEELMQLILDIYDRKGNFVKERPIGMPRKRWNAAIKKHIHLESSDEPQQTDSTIYNDHKKRIAKEHDFRKLILSDNYFETRPVIYTSKSEARKHIKSPEAPLVKIKSTKN
jgi:hypothetical protein